MSLKDPKPGDVFYLPSEGITHTVLEVKGEYVKVLRADPEGPARNYGNGKDCIMGVTYVTEFPKLLYFEGGSISWDWQCLT